MKLSPFEQRRDRLIALRSSHDAEMQRVLRSEGVDLSPTALPVHLQLQHMAADQRRRIVDALPEIETKTGRSMEVYDRLLLKAEKGWERDQKKLAEDAQRKIQGQLDAAKAALENGREEQFAAIKADIERDAKAFQDTYRDLQQRQRDTLVRDLARIDPLMATQDRRAVADNTVAMRPVPKQALELDDLPRQVAEVEKAHQRAQEQERTREKAPNSSPAPSR